MAALKNKLGRIACDGCGHPTLVKENEHGTLTMGCDECDLSSFAKRNTACAARWRAKLPKAPGQDIPDNAVMVPVKETAKEKADRANREGAAAANQQAPGMKPATPFSSLFGM